VSALDGRELRKHRYDQGYRWAIDVFEGHSSAGTAAREAEPSAIYELQLTIARLRALPAQDRHACKRIWSLLTVSPDMRESVFCGVFACALPAVGCVAEPRESITMSASTVGDYTNMGCSTAVVIGLAKQIAEQANCEHPNSFVPFTAGGGITFASNDVLPYLDQTARDDLKAVAAIDPLTIANAMVTPAQQYLLYSWSQTGMCGLGAVATVGNSDLEGGRSVEVSNYASVANDMAAHGWTQASQPAHFDHTSSPDTKGDDIHAFQVLWNLNNPADAITADGKYGPQTEARLQASPATGFAMGATCVTTPPGMYDVDVVSIAGPPRGLPQITLHYAITLKNTGTVDWSSSTVLQLANGSSSQLYDKSWTSTSVVTSIGAAVAVGKTATVAFNVTTPAVVMDTPISEMFTLDDAGSSFGMISLALTVAPSAGGSGDDTNDSHSPGGCNVGGRNGGSLVLLLALARLRRRRTGR
jgi:hypothetical protein